MIRVREGKSGLEWDVDFAEDFSGPDGDDRGFRAQFAALEMRLRAAQCLQDKLYDAEEQALELAKLLRQRCAEVIALEAAEEETQEWRVGTLRWLDDVISKRQKMRAGILENLIV